jgi:hypothetical protein
MALSESERLSTEKLDRKLELIRSYLKSVRYKLEEQQELSDSAVEIVSELVDHPYPDRNWDQRTKRAM